MVARQVLADTNNEKKGYTFACGLAFSATTLRILQSLTPYHTF